MNVDGPEGGLDALMQAMVCWPQIGWRKQARRLLILSTDNKFHHAGEGKVSREGDRQTGREGEQGRREAGKIVHPPTAGKAKVGNRVFAIMVNHSEMRT